MNLTLTRTWLLLYNARRQKVDDVLPFNYSAASQQDYLKSKNTFLGFQRQKSVSLASQQPCVTNLQSASDAFMISFFRYQSKSIPIICKTRFLHKWFVPIVRDQLTCLIQQQASLENHHVLNLYIQGVFRLFIEVSV